MKKKSIILLSSIVLLAGCANSSSENISQSNSQAAENTVENTTEKMTTNSTENIDIDETNTVTEHTTEAEDLLLGKTWEELYSVNRAEGYEDLIDDETPLKDIIAYFVGQGYSFREEKAMTIRSEHLISTLFNDTKVEWEDFDEYENETLVKGSEEIWVSLYKGSDGVTICAKSGTEDYITADETKVYRIEGYDHILEDRNASCVNNYTMKDIMTFNDVRDLQSKYPDYEYSEGTDNEYVYRMDPTCTDKKKIATAITASYTSSNDTLRDADDWHEYTVTRIETIKFRINKETQEVYDCEKQVEVTLSEKEDKKVSNFALGTFADQELEWMVLEIDKTGKALCVGVDILDTENKYMYDEESSNKASYKDSDLRKLMQSYYEKIFTDEEKEYIALSTIDNYISKNKPDEATEDYMFSLSEKESLAYKEKISVKKMFWLRNSGVYYENKNTYDVNIWDNIKSTNLLPAMYVDLNKLKDAGIIES